MSRRAIIYARISSDRAEEGPTRGRGVADQEQDARALAKRLDWEVCRVVTENDVSAFKRKRVTLPDGRKALRVIRPGFRSVLDDLTHGRADALIALDLDRAVRDPRDLEDLIDIVEQRRIPVESVTGSLRLSSDADITMARVMVAIANKSSRDTARRVGRAYLRRTQVGQYGGGKRMFGFEVDGVTHRKDEAAEIVAAANQLLEGASIREIAQDLRARGVPTVQGGPWTTASLRQMLIRPRLAGIVTYKGERLPTAAAWKPILSEEVFDAVCRILHDPDRVTSPGNTPKWLGSGIYRCPCGGPMAVHGQDRYRCTRVVFGQVKGEGHATIAARPADEVVVSVVLGRLSMADAADAVVPSTPDVDVAALQAEGSALRARLATLAEDYADGVLNRAQLAAGTKRIEARLAEIAQVLSSVTGRSPLAPLIGARDVQKAWDELPLASRRAVIDAMVRVDIARAVPGRRFDPERVVLTFK